ncbi:MAG: alpha-1,4-glucan--maltose-1-phosphate maltosyltransferase [Gemmatimonadota bacterium]|nr:alpha-1,4-glucan--maltose-1-phosphate maltosyltransferase [Gemmatimonadota bacterium]
MDEAKARRRAVVEGLSPRVDEGRYPAKRIAGEEVVVEADAFTDGHDAIRVLLLWRRADEEAWREIEMSPLGNDRWRAAFPADDLGMHEFTVEAWVDAFLTWRRDLVQRVEAEQDLAVPLEVGAGLVEEAAERAESSAAPDDSAIDPAGDAERLRDWAERLRDWADGPVPAGSPGTGDDATAPHPALDDELAELASRWPDRARATRHDPVLSVWADRPRARFSAWYEFFPRSTGPGTEHGTFEDAKAMLEYVVDLGFDVVYLPPIHPIGREKRKGPNNALRAGPRDPGSPWAIGAEEGGHTAVHPDLGTLEDFRDFRATAEKLGLEIALDVAFQCAPDHPWVEEHPEWFRTRPDGTVQYAENPPKKYEDIYPFDFETDAWESLWEALKGIFDFWIDEGVKIFRVDNPHTKAFPFWEWAIAEIRDEHPDVIFLAEAFTRPRVMHRLAKLGFTQSYTYFAWRNAKEEIEEYAREVSTPPVSDFFRPNFWPNTPDILTEALQTGGRGAFMARLVLAATLSSSYGIYGPAFELMESEPRHAGSEEYLDSEKYEIRDFDLDRADSLADFLQRVNAIRRANRALQTTRGLVFHPVDNDRLTAYSKVADEGGNAILTVVNLDPHHRQSGWVDLDLEALGLEPDESYQVHDLLGGARYVWHGGRNYVELDPAVLPAHVFRVERRVRSERDFDYFL